jgi:hypothetical protein
MSKRSLLLAFAAVASLVGLPAATASLVRALDLPGLVAEADQIVVADVLSVEAAWDLQRRAIHTTVSVGVRENWKGQSPGEGRITIRQLGGTVGEIEMKVHGMPRFEKGERSLLFLRGSHVVGMAQGKRNLRWVNERKRWRVDGGDNDSAVTIDARGKLFTAPREPALDLDELRDRVRGLVER